MTDPQKKGTPENPHTAIPLGFEYCKCAACGSVEKCTPERDFYCSDDYEGLRCEECVRIERSKPLRPDRN